jgi:predicted amidophosphoribosyltransferase
MNKNLKACGACGREIAKSASKCPHCGKAYTNFTRMFVLVVIAAIIGWIFFLGPILRDISGR